MVTLDLLAERLELADQLHFGRDSMFEPQDLPGRYGRVIKAVDHLVRTLDCEAVVGGGWAVWRHGFLGRITQDVDIVLPAARIDEFLRAASASGFDVLPQAAGRWPKVWHKETQIKVDILPEGAQPGTPDRPAPTTIPHPQKLGAVKGQLKYISLAALVELKLAAARDRDIADIVELIRENRDRVDAVRAHLAQVHADYVQKFNELVERAGQQQDA
jgi:hypothetical protein